MLIIAIITRKKRLCAKKCCNFYNKKAVFWRFCCDFYNTLCDNAAAEADFAVVKDGRLTGGGVLDFVLKM